MDISCMQPTDWLTVIIELTAISVLFYAIYRCKCIRHKS
jgi:hypothetical protein